MRGEDLQQHELFSYGSLEERVPADHPLRPIRIMVDEVLKAMDKRFDESMAETAASRFRRSGCYTPS